MTRFSPLVFALLLAGMGTLAGCGGDGVPKTVVSGKLLENGKPLVIDVSKLSLPKGATGLPPGAGSGGLVRITFNSEDGADQYQAVINTETGTFTVPGADGKGIKIGQYKIAVTASAGGAGDLFGGKFTLEKTQIKREVKAGEEIVIDVSKPGG